MTDWVCPNCRGGFPKPAEKVIMASGPEPEDQKHKELCPWCGQELGEYEQPRVHSISKVQSSEEPTPTLLEKIGLKK